MCVISANQPTFLSLWFLTLSKQNSLLNSSAYYSLFLQLVNFQNVKDQMYRRVIWLAVEATQVKHFKQG